MVLGSVLLVSLIGTGIYSSILVKKFSRTESVTEQMSLNRRYQSVIVKVMDRNTEGYIPIDEIIIEPSSDSILSCEIVKSSSGFTYEDAERRTKSIMHQVAIQDSIISISPTFGVEDGFGHTIQKLSLAILVPQNQSFRLESNPKNARLISKGIFKRYGYSGGLVANHEWYFAERGLNCVDCEPLPANSSQTWKKYPGYHQVDVNSFSSLKIIGSLEVLIEESEEYKVLVEDGAVLDIENSGRTLEVRNGWDDENLFDIFNMFKKGLPDQSGKIIIFCPYIDRIEAIGASYITATELTTDKLSIDFMGASNGIINYEGNHLNVDLKGASRLKLLGRSNLIVMNLAGASHVRANDLKTSLVEIYAAGACQSDVSASNEISGTLKGASSLTQYGSGVVKVKTSGGSHVNRVN